MEEITWKCGKCGYTFNAQVGAAPPAACPSCKEICEFKNVTCYTPECQADGLDPRLK